ncbi:regulatory protein RecX [Pseudoclavibacter soli]|uniref:regulatory protein RecX n=1 Tax=Pseudoclavibacter soli TaxID=452623 RepID=UPI00040155B2|nr:regulatory protein RecX [Pseudoclavibacter soli]
MTSEVVDFAAFRAGRQGEKSRPDAADLQRELETDSGLLEAQAQLQKLLSRRDRTEHELRGALRAHEIDEAIIDQVIGEAVASGDIDDQSLAQQLVATQLKRKSQGAVAIRRELESRGIDRDTIEHVLADPSAGAAQVAQAEALARKRLRSLGTQSPLVQRQRISATLQRKGFDSATIEQTLRRVLHSEPRLG